MSCVDEKLYIMFHTVTGEETSSQEWLVEQINLKNIASYFSYCSVKKFLSQDTQLVDTVDK